MSQQHPHCQATIIMPDAQPQPQPQLSFPASASMASMPQTQTQTPVSSFPLQPQAQAHTNYADQALIPFPTHQPPAPATASSSCKPEHLMHKNRLQECTHKLNIPLPIYQTVNEGFEHAPQFRATVLVDGAKYTSQKTFSTRKAAEQDVAELALKYISQKKPDDGFPQGFPDALPLIHKDTVFCKSILNEFATKMSMEMPTYNTIKPKGLLPVFNSSLVFNGVSYTGGAGKNKKEAEQLAARTVILSLLGDSGMGRVLYDIIKSKVKLYAALHKVSNLSTVPSMANTTHCSEGVPSKDVGAEASLAANNALTAASNLPIVVHNAAAGAVPDSRNGVPTCEFQIVGPQPSFGVNDLLVRATQATEFPIAATSAVPDSGNRLPKHEFKAQEPEHSFGANNQPEPASQATKLPIQFVHPTSALSMETGPSSKKRRKNKKKANKRLCTGAQMDKFLLSSSNNTQTSGSISSPSPSVTPKTQSADPEVFSKTPAHRSPNKNVIDLENEETTGKKKFVRKSEVWDHFTIKKGAKSGDERSVCNICGKDYACSSRTHGTSSMLVHLRKQCKKNPFRVEDKKQKLLSFPLTSESGSGLLAIGYSKEACRKALAKMVIMDELPFRSVEGEGFRHFCQVMQPKFIPPSRTTVTRDVLQLFSEEKAKLKAVLRNDCKRVSFTTDGWTSLQNIHYMCLTAHYIDSDWKLQKRIINVCTMPNGKGETIGRLIEHCMHGWGLEKVFMVTVDNAFANDSALSFFKRRVNGWKGIVLDGEFLHQRCAAHIVNLIVTEGLKEMHSSIVAIRNAVKYVKSSPARLQKFKVCVEHEKVEYKGMLVLDVPTRWNSTYMMLDVALKFQKVFDRFEEEDEKYLRYFLEEEGGKKKVGPPMKEDWANVKIFVEFLKTFYEVTLKFSASEHVTSNTFFHEICTIQRRLSELCASDDCLLSTMAFGMRRKFEKYWGNGENINCMLFIAVVLDPRYKKTYLWYCFSMIYDVSIASKLCKKVDETLAKMMSFYGDGVDNEKKQEMAANTPNQPPVQPVNELLSQFLKQRGDNREKNDLERYLAEENVNPLTPDFDILEWWKDNSKKFKVLAQIARDVLAVQVSTVASESAFSTGGRILDPFRSSLNPKMVEALVCTKNWLKSTHDCIQVRDYLDDLETYENLDNSTSCPTTTIEEPMSVD